MASGNQPIQIAGEMSTGYHFRSSVPMAPDTSASCFCEGLGGPKRLSSHFTGQKTEAQIVAQRHTALQIAEQEMGWGPLPLESVLCSGYRPQTQKWTRCHLRVPSRLALKRLEHSVRGLLQEPQGPPVTSLPVCIITHQWHTPMTESILR